MKINQYLVKTACPSSSGTLLPDHCLGVFVKHIEQAGLLSSSAWGDRCPCNRLFVNGRRIQRQTDKSNAK